MNDAFDHLYRSIETARRLDHDRSRTARLFRDGTGKMVKKLAEEAIEVGIEVLQNKRHETILESADLLYQLCVLLVEMEIAPGEIAAELQRREKLYGIAEKLPKPSSARFALPAAAEFEDK